MPSPTRLIRPAVRAGRAKRIATVAAAVCLAGIAAGAGPALAAFPGANGKIAFTRDIAGGGDIWTMSPSGGERVNLTPGSPLDGGPSWRADGRKIVFVSDSNELGTNPTPAGFESPDYELFTMNPDGSKVRQLTFNELDDEDPAWSPDGRRVVFQRDLDIVRGPDHLDYDVLTMRLSGADERNLTNSPGADRAPNWSPNGRRIAFESERDGGTEEATEIYTMSTDGSRVRRLTDNTMFDGDANWSPNGRKISFQSYREEHLSIYTMRNDGGDQKRLTFDVPGAFGSAWSPNGRIIAHSSFVDPEIFTIELDGSDARNLTNDPSAFDFEPDWQPLPRKGH